MTDLNDISSTFASLNMVPITNIADHEPPTTTSSSSRTENEGDSSEPLRVDISRPFGVYNQTSLHQIKNKKLNNICKKSSSDNHLWAPAEDQSESQRVSTSSSSSSSLYQKTQTPFYAPILPRSRSPAVGEIGENLVIGENGEISKIGENRKGAPNLDASLPVDFEEESNTTSSLWTGGDQGEYDKDEVEVRDPYTEEAGRDKG